MTQKLLTQIIDFLKHDLMRFLKPLFFLAILLCSILGAIYCIHLAHSAQNPTPKESFQLGVLLFLLSSSSAVIIGYYFARISIDEKVDTIAERSTEKMVNLSVQLHALKDYLQETEFVADDEGSVELSICAYRHRLEAASIMAASLASTNETFRSDWLGVVSSRAKNTIESRFDALKQLLQDSETIERLRRQQSRTEPESTESNDVEEQIRKLEKRIATNQQSLPLIPTSGRATPASPAVATRQEVDGDQSEEAQNGILSITILRDTYTATGSGKLSPEMSRIPKVSIQFLSGPDGYSSDDFPYHAGCGTTFDFNIALKSRVFNTPLPIGAYRFRYEARIPADPPPVPTE